MKRNSLYTLILVIFLIANVVFAFSVFLFIRQRRIELLDASLQEKIQLVSMVNETIFNPRWRGLETTFPMLLRLQPAFIQSVAGFKDVVFVKAVKPSGEIYQSNNQDEVGKNIEADYLGDIATVNSTKKTTIKDIVYNEKNIKLIIYPGYEEYSIFLGFSLDSIEQVARDMMIKDVAIGVGNLLFVLLVLLGILRRIINPLKKMTEACEEIRKGNLDVKISLKSKNEIGELAAVFNETVKDLKQSRVALEESKKILEVKVEARTKELKEFAQNLDSMVKEKTKELQSSVYELEKFYKLSVDRELKMIELKKETAKSKKELAELKKQKVDDQKNI